MRRHRLGREFIPAYRKRRIEADKIRRTASIQQKTEAESKEQEARYNADRDHIISAIQNVGNQTDRAASKYEAHESRKIAWERCRLWLDVAAVIVAGLAAWFLLRQQNTMQGQLDEMQAEQRPWVTLAGPPEIISPLTFGPAGISIDLLFAFRNTGRYPAIGVLPSNYTIPSALVTKGDEFARACNFGNREMGIYVFPRTASTHAASWNLRRIL